MRATVEQNSKNCPVQHSKAQIAQHKAAQCSTAQDMAQNKLAQEPVVSFVKNPKAMATWSRARQTCMARHGTARHDTAQHGTARHGPSENAGAVAMMMPRGGE